MIRNLTTKVVFALLIIFSCISSEAVEIPSSSKFTNFSMSFEAQGTSSLRTTIVLRKSDQLNWSQTLVSINALTDSWNSINLNLFHGQYSTTPYVGSGATLSAIQSGPLNWANIGDSGGISVTLDFSLPEIYVSSVIITKETVGTATIRNLIVNGVLEDAKELAAVTPTNTPVPSTNTPIAIPPTNTNVPGVPTQPGLFVTATPTTEVVYITYTPTNTVIPTNTPAPVYVEPVPTALPVDPVIKPIDFKVFKPEDFPTNSFPFALKAKDENGGRITFEIVINPTKGRIVDSNGQTVTKNGQGFANKNSVFFYISNDDFIKGKDEFFWRAIDDSARPSNIGKFELFIGGEEPTPTPMPPTQTPTITPTNTIVEATPTETATPRITNVPATPTATPTVTPRPFVKGNADIRIGKSSFLRGIDGETTNIYIQDIEDLLPESVRVVSSVLNTKKMVFNNRSISISADVETGITGNYSLRIEVMDVKGRTSTLDTFITVGNAFTKPAYTNEKIEVGGSNASYHNTEVILDDLISIHWGSIEIPQDTYNFHVEMKVNGSGGFQYLGQTFGDKMLIWQKAATNRIHKDFREGPETGDTYQFRLFAITNSGNINLGVSKVFTFIKSSQNLIVNQLPGRNIQVMFNPLNDGIDMSEVADFHVHVNNTYLGRFGSVFNNMFIWGVGGNSKGIIHPSFLDGPWLNASDYNFEVYAIYKDGRTPRRLFSPQQVQPTSTPIRATNTPTSRPATPTNTQIIVPTRIPATPTFTVTPITHTNTPVPSNTPTKVPPVPTNTPRATSTPTSTPTVTSTPTLRPTSTPLPERPWNSRSRWDNEYNTPEDASFTEPQVNRPGETWRADFAKTGWVPDNKGGGYAHLHTEEPTGGKSAHFIHWLFLDPNKVRFIAMALYAHNQEPGLKLQMLALFGVRDIDTKQMIWLAPAAISTDLIAKYGTTVPDGITEARGHFIVYDLQAITNRYPELLEESINTNNEHVAVDGIHILLTPSYPNEAVHAVVDSIYALSLAEFNMDIWSGYRQAWWTMMEKINSINPSSYLENKWMKIHQPNRPVRAMQSGDTQFVLPSMEQIENMTPDGFKPVIINPAGHPLMPRGTGSTQ